MQRLILNIKNENITDKLLWMLSHFKDDGVEIVTSDEKSEMKNQQPETNLSDEYIEKHWKEILMSTKSDPDYYRSEQYRLDRGQYLMEKYK